MLPMVMFGGFFMGLGPTIINFAIIIYLVLTVFQLVTLPVEFDARLELKSILLA